MGMPQIHPHVFRHTWATHAAEDGVAMNIIAGFLGDTDKTVEKKLPTFVARLPSPSSR